MTDISFKNFFKFLRPYKKKISIILSFQLLIIASSLAVPYLLGNVIHRLEVQSISFSFLIKYFIIIISVYIVWNFSSVIVNIVFEFVNKSVENDIREYCYKKILDSPMSKLQGKSEGEIITKVIRDTEKVEKAFSSMFSLADSVIHSIGLVIVMFTINIMLASIIFSLFLLIVLIHRITTNPLKVLYNKYKQSEEILLTDLKNQISGFFTTKVFSLEDKSMKLLKDRNNLNLKNHMKINTKASIIKYFNFFISSVFRVAAIIIGACLYLVSRINIGQIFSIYTYSIQLSNLLRNIIEIDIMLKDVITSFSRVMNFLNEFEEIDKSNSCNILSIDTIEFKNVNFKYDKKDLISNLSFIAKKGTTIGIKGQNGSGKTTLTYLLCGFYKPDGILLNDVSIQHYSEKEILKRVSYVLQNVHLFPATVIDNLTCFGNVSKELVYDVCKKIGLHDKIIKLPEGYNTVINEKNLNLSGGEKQLISLARALLKDSDLLILDEMNSALDLKTEDKLIKNIIPYFEKKIVFIISHKEKVFNICDAVIDLDNNCIYLKK